MRAKFERMAASLIFWPLSSRPAPSPSRPSQASRNGHKLLLILVQFRDSVIDEG
jgi:hypothetical protein